MRDVDGRSIARAGAAIALAIAAAVAGVFALVHFSGVPPGGARLPGDDALRDAPAAWTAPQPAREQWQREKLARLQSAGWVDRGAGIAHIPIGDAMDLLVARRERQ
jgi:hypothetical protein